MAVDPSMFYVAPLQKPNVPQPKYLLVDAIQAALVRRYPYDPNNQSAGGGQGGASSAASPSALTRRSSPMSYF